MHFEGVKKGTVKSTEEFQLLKQKIIIKQKRKESWMHLEAVTIEINVGKEYYKLYIRNFIKGVNTWTVSHVIYSGHFLNCTKRK